MQRVALDHLSGRWLNPFKTMVGKRRMPVSLSLWGEILPHSNIKVASKCWIPKEMLPLTLPWHLFCLQSSTAALGVLHVGEYRMLILPSQWEGTKSQSTRVSHQGGCATVKLHILGERLWPIYFTGVLRAELMHPSLMLTLLHPLCILWHCDGPYYSRNNIKYITHISECKMSLKVK